MKQHIGGITGTLRLQVGDADLNLGTVPIPLSVMSRPRTESGSEEVAIEIAADLKQVRAVIQELFSQEAE